MVSVAPPGLFGPESSKRTQHYAGPLADLRQIEAYLATVILGKLLREMPRGERQFFVKTVASRLPEPVIDYVRLQISAVRP